MDLFKGKKVLYVHGFASSGQSGTVTRIREVLTQATVIAPDIPIHPEEAITLLNNICTTEKPDLIIMGDTMKEHGMIGAQHFQNPRQDGVQDFIVTKALVKEYKDITDRCFDGIDDEEQNRVWGLFGDEDTTVNTYDLFREHYPHAVRFHGEHRMNDNSFMHSVVPVIRWISDKQERRERPIVYISTRALIDQYGKPLSSSQKAIRQLLETYQLYFVAPAHVDAQHYADVNAWLYEYINVPAYGHTIFTNQLNLLYGGMATLIQFGSDTFKTWDDIIPYFERLGGQ